ncbi:MAG: AMP-binding protein [Desulfosarcina sp.]
MHTNAESLERELTFSRFDRMSQKYPDRSALIYLGRRFSYRRLKDLSERFAGALSAMGVFKGHRVMLYIPNCPQWVIAFLGIQRIGAVVVPVAPIYTSHEIIYMINDADVETVICMDTNFCYVQEAFAKTGLKRVIVTNLTDQLPAWKRMLGHLFDKIPTGTVDAGPRVQRFNRLLDHAPPATATVIDPAQDLSYILYTGGTTGFPKGVPGNHLGMTSYVNDVSDDVAGEYLQEGRDTYIAINPLFHIMALGLFMAVGLNKGNTTLLMPFPVVDAILETIQRYRVRWLLGVPALYRMILENDRQDRYDLSSLTYCYCGGDVLPEEVKERWHQRCGTPIYQVYGSTEVGHVAYSRIGEEPSPRAIGFPLKSRQCLIVDPATLNPVEAGKRGELLVSSPYTLNTYYNKPAETKKTYVEIGGKTWCRMGDFVSLLPSGELIYMERSADIIKHKAFRVSASEVEAILQDHPTVIGACVVGVPDPKVGERIKAIVVLKEDARGVGGTELIRWCRDHLAAYKVPSYIEFRDMLPKSKVGKLLRREVRDDEIRRISKGKPDQRVANQDTVKPAATTHTGAS